MKWVMRVAGTAFGLYDDGERYLKSCDFNSGGGRGHAVLTKRIDDAMLFDSSRNVMKFWQTQSTRFPTRPDGQPNRPLTSYTIEPLQVEVTD